jgi:hypothetical protein
VAYRDELAPFVDAPYLEEPLQDRARAVHRVLSQTAGRHQGRVPPNLFEVAQQLRHRLEAQRQAAKLELEGVAESSVDSWRSLLPDYAKEALATARRLHEEQLAGPIVAAALPWHPLHAIDELDLDVVVAPPGVFGIERDPGWDELAQARERARMLRALRRNFERELPESTTTRDELLPVLVLHYWGAYGNVLLGGLAPKELPTRDSAWYDPSRGIIVLRGDAPYTDFFYAASRALLDRATTGAAADPWARTAWLREGLAAWFASAHRTVDPESGDWTYEFGAIDGPRALAFPRTRAKLTRRSRVALALPSILQASYLDLATGPISRISAVTSSGIPGIPREPHLIHHEAAGVSGWHLFASRALLLVHFLREFEMDAQGRVLIAPPGGEPIEGRYRSRWRAYLREALHGRDDVATFRATFDLEGASEFEAFCELFDRYERWVDRKMRLGHVSSGRLIPYDRYVNRCGDKTGRSENDVLPR